MEVTDAERVASGGGGADSAEAVASEGRGAAKTRALPEVVRCVVFDKDGVLVNTEPEHERRLRVYLGECGIDCSEMPCLYGSNNEATWSWVEPCDPERRERLYQGFRRRWHDEPIPYAQLLDSEALAVLRTLRAAGLRVGLASSSPAWAIEGFLRATRLLGQFDAVLSGEQCPATKPAPDVYLEVMRELGVKPAEAVVVEDSLRAFSQPTDPVPLRVPSPCLRALSLIRHLPMPVFPPLARSRSCLAFRVEVVAFWIVAIMFVV